MRIRDNRTGSRGTVDVLQAANCNRKLLGIQVTTSFRPSYSVFRFGRVEAEWKCGLIDSPSRTAAKGFGGHSVNKVAEALYRGDST